jgi:phosphoribosylanthranilate isomerase
MVCAVWPYAPHAVIPVEGPMDPTPYPRVKICCIMSHAEARLAIQYGASALGLVGEMPSGPGPIPDDLIAEIALRVPPPVATFLLTSRQSVGEIVAHHARVHTSAVQVVDVLTSGSYAELRDRLPGIKIVQVIHVVGPRSVDEAVAIGAHVDAILLDSGRPDLQVKELGGTGRRHDWALSRTIREALRIPIFLAGGLNGENVREAIDMVAPFGVDVCSGVRTVGKLDESKVKAFMRAAGGRRD